MSSDPGRGEPHGIRRLRRGMAAGFAVMATLHVVTPRAFEATIPPELPGGRRFWNRAAAAAEATCALLLARRETARSGGWLAAATLTGVFPANLEAVRRGGYPGAPGVLATRTAAIARLPLQVPMIWAAVRVARASD